MPVEGLQEIGRKFREGLSRVRRNVGEHPMVESLGRRFEVASARREFHDSAFGPFELYRQGAEGTALGVITISLLIAVGFAEDHGAGTGAIMGGLAYMGLGRLALWGYQELKNADNRMR